MLILFIVFLFITFKALAMTAFFDDGVLDEVMATLFSSGIALIFHFALLDYEEADTS